MFFAGDQAPPRAPRKIAMDPGKFFDPERADNFEDFKQQYDEEAGCNNKSSHLAGGKKAKFL